MIYAEDLLKTLDNNKISFFTGVPDSILKDFTNYLDFKKKKNLIAVNEGSAAAIAIGYNIKTGKIPCVYLQNSGLGNALNPILSVASSDVYKNSILFIVGHRGYNGKGDEPQHLLTGKITKKILSISKVNYISLKNFQDLKKLNKLIKDSKKNKKLICCLVRSKTLKLKRKIINKKNMKGIDISYFLEKLIFLLNSKKNLIVSSTGYPSRELLRSQLKNNIKLKVIYNVGGMGHTSSIAYGISENTQKTVLCLDGDGSLLMHFGSLHTIGGSKKSNFKYILLNNNIHGSVGGQKTNFDNINFKSLSTSLNFKRYMEINDKKKVEVTIKKFLKLSGPSVLQVYCSSKNSSDLPRVKNFSEILRKFNN